VALTPGTRLGPYEVTAQIGAGGMGEVYRATDTNLKRVVAIKVLPASVAADAERLARFQREAEVLASLNHPNIAQIHGLEKSDGTTALVMELVEGPTLADRIAQGPIPIDEALPIAKQIAEALEAAHEHAIIHRDLKPANVKVRSDGVVKVLDFGLAKALEPAGSVLDASQSPTITSPAMMTGVGVLLGTAAYMSPEQARGKEVDRRADIWAFGGVLYEMLTGRPAFPGADVSEVLAGVIKSEVAWNVLPPNTPGKLRALLRRCLQKDPKQRLRDIGDARLEIEEMFVSSLDEVRVFEAPPRSRRRVAVAIAALSLTTAATAVAVWGVLRPDAPRVSRLMIAPSASYRLSITGDGRSVAVSRDGNRVAYVGDNGTLLLRPVDQLDPAILVREDSPVAPFFSPDGRWVAYFSGNRGVRKVNIDGGPTVLVSKSDSARPGGGTWAEDGNVVFATTNGATGLHVVHPDTTVPKVLTVPDRQRGEADHLWPEFLPGGGAVVFTITSTDGRLDSSQVAVFDLRAGTYKTVVPAGSHAHYVPTGHLVYNASGTLRAVRFDLDRLEATGRSVEVASGVLTTSLGAAEFDVAANGTLVYVPGKVVEGARRELVWMGRDGKAERIDAPVRAYIYPRLSPDGTRVLLDSRDQDNDIWLWDLRRETLTNLTANPALERFPLWTADGKQFIFVSDRDGASAIYRQAANGTGTAERLSEGTDVQQTPNAISADGKQLVFDRSGDLFTLALDGSRRVSPLIQTPLDEGRAALSPDGRWLAYHANEGGRPEVFVRPFPSVDTGKLQVSKAGGVQPWWGRTGSELFYFTLAGMLMSMTIGGSPTPTSGTLVSVFDAGSFFFQPNGTAAATFDVSPDGRRFLMIKQVASTDATSAPREIVLVQHWLEELKRLVATK
jgi:eukaryotic-like serine/threonine-protein kinase